MAGIDTRLQEHTEEQYSSQLNETVDNMSDRAIWPQQVGKTLLQGGEGVQRWSAPPNWIKNEKNEKRSTAGHNAGQ